MAHRLSPKRISSICPTLWNIGRAVLLLAFLQCPVRSQDYTISYRYFDGGQDYSSVGYWGQLVDSRGFLWIGNQTGLDRFDGHTFTSYNHRVHGLPDEVISGIAEDEEGMLWLLHRFFYFGETVMSLFDPNTEQSISLETYLSTSLPFPASDAAVIAGNRNTGIYILTRSGGLYRYYNQSFSYLGNTQRVEQNATLLPLVQGGCWVGIGQHLVRYTAEGKVVDQIDCVQDLRKFIRADENGLPWYTTLRLRDSLQVDYQLWQGRKRRSQFATQRGGPGTMSFLGMDTTQGITYLISPKHEYDTLIVTDTAGHPLSLHPHSVSFSSPHYYPLTPTFWNQTIEKGMFLVHTQQNRFLLPGQRQVAGARGLLPLADGSMIVHSDGPTYLFDPQKGRELYQDSVTQDPLFYLGGRSFLIDIQGDRWHSTRSMYLIHAPATGPPRKVTYRPKDLTAFSRNGDLFFLQPSAQWGLFQTPAGQLWIGHQHGLSYLDTTDGYLHMYEPSAEFARLVQSTVYHFHETRSAEDPTVWLATNQGLFRWHPDQGIQAHIRAEDPASGLPYNHIAHIYEDPSGWLWLASKGGGLIRWHPRTHQSQQWTTAEGLSDDVLYGIYADDFGHLWFSSNHGIMRFDTATYEVNVYQPQDGTSSMEYNTGSHYQQADGTLFFGGLNGITQFHPADFEATSSESSPLYLTRLSVQEPGTGALRRLPGSAWQYDTLRLRPHQLGFTLEFAYLNYKRKNSRFSYQLEGVDADWTYFKEPIIRLNSLPYGYHTLWVRAQGDFGNWEDPVSLVIFQQRPFYLRTWFFLLATTVLILSVVGYVRLRTQQARKRQLTLEKQVGDRTLALRQAYQLVNQQKVELQQRNQDISSSILYAQQLQQGILATQAALYQHLGPHFVVYHPRDIVSGDFYWLLDTGDTVYVAVADCTGHGVPGAMVSVMGNGCLIKAVDDEGLRGTDDILNRIRELMIMMLSRNKTEMTDGMDITLAALHRQTNTLQWSGAFNPLWIINPHRSQAPEGAMAFTAGHGGYELKGDRQPIGKYPGWKSFSQHSIALEPGDTLYLPTDGFQDQFGGPKGKKFTAKRLKQTLLDLYPLTLEEQGKELKRIFEEWKGRIDQVDDVTLLGFRI